MMLMIWLQNLGDQRRCSRAKDKKDLPLFLQANTITVMSRILFILSYDIEVSLKVE